MSTATMIRPAHTCPTRAVFNPNCPACVAGAFELAEVEPGTALAVPPAMATPATFGCTGDRWCDCPFCPPGSSTPPAPLPLHTAARLYRMVTTRRVTYVWAVARSQAVDIFTGAASPLGVPSAPQPADHLVLNDGAHLWHDEPTPAWSAWFARYRVYLWHRLADAYGECLIRVEGPYPR